MVKLHILGGPGSGKTTLAQDVSFRFHIPHYDLDKVNWDLENAIATTKQPAWITEGIYLIWTETLLYHADYIVLLEVSWPVAAWRIVYRHISNSLRGTNPYPGINGVKALFKLLLYTRRYYLNQDNTNRPSIESPERFQNTSQEIAIAPTEEFFKRYVETFQEFTVPPTEKFVRMYLEKYKEKVVLVKNTADREQLFKLLANR